MHTLRTGLDLDQFMKRVSRAEQRALFLDFHGTLAPFRVERDHAVPYPGVREVLTTILKVPHTRIIVISGQSIQGLQPLLGLEPLPELWGTHGWERLLPNGKYSPPTIAQSAQDGLTAAEIWIKDNKLSANYERKPASLALHWRGLEAPVATNIHDRVLEYWIPLARASGLTVHGFDGGLELRVPGRDKGFAVRAVLSEMVQGVVAAYLGDDLTDEDAFKAMKGRGLSILVRAELRPTAADLWLRPPDELLEFLAMWQHACAG